MKTRPATEYVLLGAMMGGPRHGYEILRFLNTSLDSTWYVSTSQLYSLLKRLDDRGLLESMIEAQETRPSKRVFSLTPKGEKAFLTWLHRPTQHVRDIRMEFLAKLFFFRRLSMKGSGRLIENQLDVLQKIRKKIENKQKRVDDPFENLVLGFKTQTLDAWLHWLVHEAASFIQENDHLPNCIDGENYARKI